MVRRLYWTSLCSLALALCLAAGAPAADAGVTVAADKTAYGEDTMRIYMTLHNGTAATLTLDSSFRLQQKMGGAWRDMPPQSKTDDYGVLDAAGVQFPVEPGADTRLGAYIGGYRARVEERLAPFAPGDYRVVVRDAGGGQYAAPFAIVAGDVLADPAEYEMEAERPAYDAQIDAVRLTIRNHTGEEASYGSFFALQKRQTDGKWEKVSFKEGAEKAFPGLAAILPAGGEGQETVSLAWYDRPFSAGRYRIMKELNADDLVAAEFDILPLSRTPALPEAAGIRLTCRSGGRAGAADIGREDVSALSDVRHELMAFRRASKPAGAAAEADASAVITPAQEKGAARQKSVRVELFADPAGGEKTYLRLGGQWYAADDGGVLPRLTKRVKELGGFLPATGEELTAALRAQEALKSVRFEPHSFTTPFALEGWLADRDVSGVNLSIFRFPSATETNRQARYIRDGGYSIGKETREGATVSFGYERYEWGAPPHYYKCGPMLALYLGEDPGVLAALKNVLGDEIDTGGE